MSSGLSGEGSDMDKAAPATKLSSCCRNGPSEGEDLPELDKRTLMRLEAAEVEVGGMPGGGPPSPLDGISSVESPCLAPATNKHTCILSHTDNAISPLGSLMTQKRGQLYTGIIDQQSQIYTSYHSKFGRHCLKQWVRKSTWHFFFFSRKKQNSLKYTLQSQMYLRTPSIWQSHVI